MGSYTDVAIAIDKETWARHYLLQKVPGVLTQEPCVEADTAVYWYLESQKWYQGDPEIAEVHAFFDKLEEEGDIITDREWTDHQGKVRQHVISRFGCMLMHESGETTEFGSPIDFDMFRVTYIDCPGRDALLKREAEAHKARFEEAKEADQ